MLSRFHPVLTGGPNRHSHGTNPFLLVHLRHLRVSTSSAFQSLTERTQCSAYSKTTLPIILLSTQPTVRSVNEDLPHNEMEERTQ